MKPLAFLLRRGSQKKRPIKISAAAQNAAVKLAGPKDPEKQISGLWMFLSRKPKQKSVPPAPRKAESDNKSPKNGRLTLAVAAAALIAVVLGVANFKLIRVHAPSGTAFGTVGAATERAGTGVTAAGPSTILDNKTSPKPPEVTFYQELTVQDEQKTAIPAPACQPQETDLSDRRPAKSSVASPVEKHEDSKHKLRTQADKLLGAEGQPASQPIMGPARYTVQVGAFAHPSIAQEWAIKWKARGYDVSLKPVARPNTGIIYRLYLGNFPSEKQADELVKHLKAKEGISGLRLTVRN